MYEYKIEQAWDYYSFTQKNHFKNKNREWIVLCSRGKNVFPWEVWEQEHKLRAVQLFLCTAGHYFTLNSFSWPGKI